MLKILNIDPDHYSKQAHQILSTIGRVDSVNLSHTPLVSIIEQYHVLIMRFAQVIDKTIIDNAPNLKVIACNVTGVDHIDVNYARQKNIEVICLKGETEFLNTIYATAELTWGLMIALLRKIPTAHNHVTQGRWHRDYFLTHELHGKHLGIVGYGRIGKKVASYARAFGMSVSAYDSDPSQYDNNVTSCNNLTQLFSASDIVSIHLPLNETTRHSINEQSLSSIKKGAYLINTARGDIVKEQDVIAALDEQHLSAYATDVISGEYDPLSIENNPLVAYAKKYENLLITPHIGGVTQESWEKTEIFIARKVVKLFAADKHT